MILTFVLVLLVLIGCGVIILSNNAVAIQQAQAQIETARAAQSAARAAQISAGGQAAVGMGQMLFTTALIVIILGLAVLTVYLYLKSRAASVHQSQQWMPGQGASVGRLEAPRSGGVERQIEMLIQLELLNRISRLPSPPNGIEQLPDGFPPIPNRED